MKLHDQHTVLSSLVIFITFWRAQSALLSADLVVSQDGTGDFKMITQAIQAVPINRTKRFFIRVKTGLYNEYLIIGKERTNITMFGDGIRQTIISGKRHAGPGIKTSDTATVAIYGEGFVARDIAFQNVAGPHCNQSVAVMIKAEKCAFYRCRFSGFQDTLYAKDGYQFFRECQIYGTVDFIFGDATVVFQKCFIYARRPLPGQSNTIAANGRAVQTRTTGTILHNCTIMSAPDLRKQGPEVKTYLGRPWKTLSRTVIMQSFLGSLIDPEGWLKWEGHTQDQPFYAEYNNSGPGANTTKRVEWEKPKVITAFEATSYTVRNFIRGESWIPSTEIPYDLDLLQDV